MRRPRSFWPLLAIVAGCARGDPKPSGPLHDPDRARVALVAALDAWKKGEAGSLPRRDPPIRFVDSDQKEGCRLAEYEIEEPDAPIVLHRDVSVILSLRDPKGKGLRREARYQVATEPSLAVLRTDR